MKHYVYIYLNPTKTGPFNYGNISFDYEPFYVGYGKEDRKYNHLTEKLKGNKHKYYTIRKLIENDTPPIIITLYENLTPEKARFKEVELIKLIGRNDLKQGPLTNMTDGGDGPINKIVSKETKRKLSKAQKEYCKKYGSQSKGKTHGDVAKKNMSDAWTPERIKKQAERMKGNIFGVGQYNPKYGKNNSFHGKHHTNETKQKIREKLGKRWLITDPEGNEYNVTGMKSFCEERNLNRKYLRYVAQGKWRQYKGWKAQEQI
jgi:hypothetical protein